MTMKTKQEQIEEMIKIFTDNRDVCHHMRCVECKYHGYEDCVYSSCAYSLYQAGYGDVSEYKAEREMLGSQIKVLKQRLNNKYVEVDNLSRDYSNAFERLKAQQREIDRLKAENCELTKKLEARLTCDFVKTAQKQAKIGVLNKAKERLDSAPNGWAYTGYIDDLIEEVQNGEDKS